MPLQERHKKKTGMERSVYTLRFPPGQRERHRRSTECHLLLRCWTSAGHMYVLAADPIGAAKEPVSALSDCYTIILSGATNGRSQLSCSVESC